MRKSEPTTQETDYLKKLGYEPSDVSIPTLGRWIFILFGFIGFSALAAYLIYIIFVPEIGKDAPLPAGGVTRLPPEPNPVLQANPKNEMREFRIGEERRLYGYGYTDKEKKTVFIPVSEAMKKILSSGKLPTKLEGGAPGTVQASPNVDSSTNVAPMEAGPTMERLKSSQADIPPDAGSTVQHSHIEVDIPFPSLGGGGMGGTVVPGTAGGKATPKPGGDPSRKP